jgi:hypothetical protein
MPLFEFVAYTRFLCFVINNDSSCFGRKILTDPNFDFIVAPYSRLICSWVFEISLQYTELCFQHFLLILPHIIAG